MLRKHTHSLSGEPRICVVSMLEIQETATTHFLESQRQVCHQNKKEYAAGTHFLKSERQGLLGGLKHSTAL